MFAKNSVSQSMLDAVNSVLVEDKKKMITDAEIDETGFHKAAHAARKANQTHFEFQGKKYPVTAKSHSEGFEDAIKAAKEKNKPQPSGGAGMKKGSRYGGSKQKDDTHDDKEKDMKESKDCVTEPEAKKIAKKEVGYHNVTMHKGQKSTVKEGSFASKLLNHITENKAASPEDIFTDNNLGEEEMSDAQMKKREKIVMSMKKGLAGFKQRYGKNYKNVMYATATKQAMKEDSSDEWNGSYDFVLNEKEEVEQLDELGLRTLISYKDKAKADMDAKKGSYKRTGTDAEKLAHTKKMDKDVFNRRVGMTRAQRKIGVPVPEEVEIEEGDAQYKKDVPMKKMSDVIDRKKTVKSLMKGRQYFGTGKMKEEVELDEMDKSQKSQERHGDYPLGLKNKDVNMTKANTSKKVKKDTLKLLNKAFNKEEVELDEKNDSHTHAAHYENDKGEWSGMKLFTAKDDQDAIRQAHQNCEKDCRLSKVERHMTVKEDVEVSKDKSAHKITTDMLSGRQPGGKLNSFKNFKVNLTVAGEEDIPKEMDKGEDTKEKQKITTNPGAVDIKLDDKYGHPTPQSHFSSQERITSEEVHGELKKIRNKEHKMHDKEIEQFNKKVAQKEEVEVLDENRLLDKYLLSKGINPKFISRDAKISHSKSNAFKSWAQNHQNEAVEIPFDGPYEKNKGDEKGNIKDKSGAIHTPMSRAKELARDAFKKIKKETMMGKISN